MAIDNKILNILLMLFLFTVIKLSSEFFSTENGLLFFTCECWKIKNADTSKISANKKTKPFILIRAEITKKLDANNKNTSLLLRKYLIK